MIATRESYGKALAELEEKNKNIVVLDADLSSATKTKEFATKFPDKFINLGIAEQDMMATAAGLATCGKIPFASTFAVFATGRAYDQIRNSICYPNLNVKIAATHAGITVGEDGATHQALEDINIVKALPNMTVLCPCDDISTKWAIKKASEINGPVYIRLTRPKVENVYDENEIFELDKAKVIGDGGDIAFITNGITMHECIKAKDILKEKGINARIVDLHTIKPVDKQTIIETAKQVKHIITVEDHNIIGGIGSIVADVLAEEYPTKIYKIGINDEFGKSGKWNELLTYYGLDGNSIANKAMEIIRK
ncbi:MAG: transketolase family protein [Clostridiales bacterium]|nr:transketolase family protein [Clostridiales bacterium]